MSNQSQGAVLAGQPVAVTAGPGITIDPSTGIISFNSATAVGVMRLNNPGAYDAYVWPLGGGTVGQQLTSDGAGNLSWANAAGIPWTAKGQLVVGTGLNTDTILSVGTNTAVLMADSTTTSGLVYSNTVTSAMQSPAGATAQRPNPATAGQFRYNTDTQKFEFATGATTWQQFASADPAVGTFVSQTVPTTGSPSAIIPTGTTAQQQTVPAPLAGYTRFNTTTSLMEVFDGTVWSPVGASPTAGLGINITGSIVKVSIPTASTPPAAGALAAQAVVGSMYWDDTLNQLFIYYSNGGTPVWVQAAPAATGGGSTYTATAPIKITGTVISIDLGLGVATNGTNLAFKMPVAALPPAINTSTTGAFDGSMYWDDTLAQLFIRYNNGGTPAWVAAAPPGGGSTLTAASLAEAAAGVTTVKYSSPATAVAKDAAGTTGAALIPAGTDAQRAAIAAPVVGMQRYNTTSGYEEVYTGATLGWRKVAWDTTPTPPADLTISANTVLDNGVYSVNNLTIAAGATVTTNGQMIVFECTGTATIAGTVNLNSSGPLGGSGSLANATVESTIGGQGLNIGAGITAGGGRPYAPVVSQVGSSGAGGISNSTGGGAVQSGAGGSAGGGIIIRAAKGIVVTGTLTSTGANGGPAGGGLASFASGGAGGGSGGVVILRSDETINFSGTINVSGGAGATGVFTAPYVGANGGGGGGGGIVVLQCPGTLTNTGTVTLTAGATGVTTGTLNAIGSGGGGACGGAGGTAAVAAGAGKLLFSGSPI
jgi:hypothetical protein